MKRKVTSLIETKAGAPAREQSTESNDTRTSLLRLLIAKKEARVDRSRQVAANLELSATVQDRLVTEITEMVAGWFRCRAEEVLSAPGDFGSTLNEVRWSIAGCVAQDLEGILGDDLEDALEESWPR